MSTNENIPQQTISDLNKFIEEIVELENELFRLKMAMEDLIQKIDSIRLTKLNVNNLFLG